MNITLPQSEIELAIQNHILSQVNLRPGSELVINLSATRGDEGYTATIIILSPGMKAPTKAPIVVEAPVVQAPVCQAPVVQAPVVQAPVVQVPIAQAAAPVSVPVTSLFNKVPQTPTQIREAMDAELEQEAKQAPADVGYVHPAPEPAAANQDEAPRRPQSLFKGLRKPVNA